MNNSGFFDLANNRYSVRKFNKQKPQREQINLILEAGRVAPTACNFQPQKILVLESDSALDKLKKCTKYHFDCTLAILVCCDKNLCWTRSSDGKNSGDIDASIVTTHMMLEAYDLGIGSTWVMSFDPESLRKEFNIPEEYETVSLLVMGYPSDDAKPYPGHINKKPLSEMVSYNFF